jgi:hypothetical protein
MHLSCVKISTISKRTETSFHLSLITSKHHQVHPKWLQILWYIWCKPCTYLSQTLTPSPNGPKRDLTWPTSPRGSIGCVHNDFQAYGTFNTNRATILRKDSTISKWTETSYQLSLINLEYHQVHPKWFLTILYVWRTPCTYLALTLAPSPNRPKQDSPWPTSPRSSIGCVQNDFWAYGTFGINYASILRQD